MKKKNRISLLKLSDMVKVTVLNRPSKIIKSPFMADVLYNGKQYMAHSPSLSCCGFVSTGRQVWAQKRIPNDKSKAKSDFTIYLGISLDTNIQVGIHPSLGNQIARTILDQKLLDLPFNYSTDQINQEVTYGNSRFDFQIHNEEKHIIQVKYVPIALHQDMDIMEYDQAKYKNENHFKKIALFPVGQKGTKCLKDAVSPRAVKHLQEMSHLVIKKKVTSATLLFIILRSDISTFKISQNDVYYLKAVREAKQKGVNFKAVCIQWQNSEAFFRSQIDVLIP